MQMEPTMTTVDQELLRRALVVAQDSREFVSELLTQHDATLGRTTRKNWMWAEELEKDEYSTPHYREPFCVLYREHWLRGDDVDV